jgi:succinyl-CoA synthetase alpha subunit
LVLVATQSLELQRLKLQHLMADPETKGIIVIGEIGGELEPKRRSGSKKMAIPNLLLVLSQVKLRQKVVRWVTQAPL